MSRLAGKVAIVTGGASGIGRGAVELFLREGAKVVAADVQDDKGALLVEELGPSVSYVRADVGEEREVEALVADTVKRHGRLDCMFNNAGLVGISGPITDTPIDEAEAAFRVLFWGVVFGMKYAGRVMREQKSGSILSTASVAGVGTGMGPHIYSAAKAAVIHLHTIGGEGTRRKQCPCELHLPGRDRDADLRERSRAWNASGGSNCRGREGASGAYAAEFPAPVSPRTSRRRRSFSPATTRPSSTDMRSLSMAA